MNRRVKTAALALAFTVLLSLSGCYTGAIEQYFSLPKPTEEYLQLQSLIDQELASGSEYAAPTAGNYRQSVQLVDLDGDGLEEALAFFRSAGESLKICIYAAGDREYCQMLSIQGEGASVGSVEYADLDGDGLLELIVAWQIGTGMRLLSVYQLSDWSGRVLLTTDCSEFLVTDMNQDGQSDLMVLRSTGAGAYWADMCLFPQGAEPTVSTAALSPDISVLQRVRAVCVTGDVSALLVESAYDNGDLVSDLFVNQAGTLVNLIPDGQTRRAYASAYAQDINGDRCIEIPDPSQLYSQTGDLFWSITWYGYDRYGTAYPRLNTYHCYDDGWYLILPSGWENGLTVRRDDSIAGERAVILSRVSADGSINDLLTIYTLTGDNRSERAQIAGRFVILEEDSTVYAARIAAGITEEEVRENFKIIYAEWSTGSV